MKILGHTWMEIYCSNLRFEVVVVKFIIVFSRCQFLEVFGLGESCYCFISEVLYCGTDICFIICSYDTWSEDWVKLAGDVSVIVPILLACNFRNDYEAYLHKDGYQSIKLAHYRVAVLHKAT